MNRTSRTSSGLLRSDGWGDTFTPLILHVALVSRPPLDPFFLLLAIAYIFLVFFYAPVSTLPPPFSPFFAFALVSFHLTPGLAFVFDAPTSSRVPRVFGWRRDGRLTYCHPMLGGASLYAQPTSTSYLLLHRIPFSSPLVCVLSLCSPSLPLSPFFLGSPSKSLDLHTDFVLLVAGARSTNPKPQEKLDESREVSHADRFFADLPDMEIMRRGRGLEAGYLRSLESTDARLCVKVAQLQQR
ncbi:hypothetical protein FA13DRAFT_1455546 [Coprinellus micaceus]|uniref:Uncharacterized protein n=1 Tax=Coprinellus micaceus TaxID=71717 RepID=A0A4Y7SMQ6_COPMI|nr:hypothetical protein FA13DRAFT_1455546 [Coprinellus micaceus]